MSARVLLLLLSSITLAFGACGSGSSDGDAVAPAPEAATSAPATSAANGTSTTDTTPVDTTAPWIARVNDICIENRDRLAADGKKIASEGATDRTALTVKVLESSLPIERTFLARLRKEEIPADVTPAWTAFLDTLDGFLDIYPQLVETVRSGKNDPELNTKIAQIAASTRPFATKYGLDDCLPDQNG